MTEPIGRLVEFAQRLRAAGLPVGPGDTLAYTSTVALLGLDLVDLYWAGRTTLVTRPEQIPTYDEAFRVFFLGQPAAPSTPPPPRLRSRAGSPTVFQIPATEPAPDAPPQRPAQLGLLASDVDILRDKAFTACTPAELAALRRILARLRLTPPRRRGRRTRPARRGPLPDPRRWLRASLRLHRDELRWRRRRPRPRKLVLILDISGSMADYSRNLVQFAHTALRAQQRVEVFCFGTTLSRVTTSLRRRSLDDALARAAAAVVDWEGGTRIGQSLESFVRSYGRRGLARGGIVVICSDGLDRGAPDLLAHSIERLARLCHAIVWLTPLAESPSPPLGMLVVSPFVDLVLPAHDLRSLESFVARLPSLR